MSGSTWGGVVGAAIGYVVSGGDMQATQAGWMVGSAVGGYVDPDVIKGQRLSDAQQQTASEGAPRPIVYGTAVVAGNIIHAGPLVEHKNRARTGKGGPVQENYSYTRTYAMRICEGPIGNISRIWRDDKLVVDWRNPADWPDAADDIRALAADSARFASGITIYTGSETQLPDPTLEALPEANGGGVGNVCAHRGTCYVVFADDDLTDRQGAIPQYRFEVSCCGTTTTTQNPVAWVHGHTGTAQTIFSGAMFGLTALVGGWNDNLRRTTNGGVTWQAVPYTTALGWDPADAIIAIWHVEDPFFTEGLWYIALGDSIATSSNGGASFTPFNTPDQILQGQVYFAGGIHYAGAAGATNTTIFQPLLPGDSRVDLGANYGVVNYIADVAGSVVIGTSLGYIVTAGGSVLHHEVGATIGYIASNSSGSIIIATCAGGFLRSADGGSTWTFITPTIALGDSIAGVVYARGQFYFNGGFDLYTSVDGLTLTLVDSSFAGASAAGPLMTDGFSVLATASADLTAALPSAYVLPDTSGWHIDNTGSVVGDLVTSVDRCVAQLDATVLDICDRAGVPAGKVDVTQLAGIDLRGFVIGQPLPASEAIRTLQQGYFFDFPEWGDWPDTATKLRAIKRGGANVFALTDDDFVESDEDQDTREQVVEFPRKINLVTSDVDSDYNPTKQTFTRRTGNVKAVGESTLQLALSTLRTEAAPMVDIMGKVAWEEALGTAERELPEDFTQYTPSDCGTLNGKRHRLEKAEMGDGTVKWTMVRDRASAYVSTATPGDAPPPSPPTSTLRGPTVFAAMNLPSLRTADNVPGMYVAVCGLLDGWVGCDLYLSVDLGLSYALVRTLMSEATMGTLAAACDSGATDLITASVLHGHQLDSVTASQIAARANGFAVLTGGGSGVNAEIGQFQTATETATPRTYDLTNLTRHELGTMAAVHYAGDRFVLLDGNVDFLELNADLAGKTLYFRPVSRGTAVANNPVYQVVFQPQFTSPEAIDFYTNQLGEVYTDQAGAYYRVTS